MQISPVKTALVLAATAALGSSAQAAAPPAPYEAVSLYDLGVTYAPGSYSGLSQSGGYESASLSGFPQPTLTANASGVAGDMVSGGIAHLDYSYEVVGPASGTPLTLLITGFLLVRNSSADGYAKAYITSDGRLSKTVELSSAGELQASPNWLISVLPGSLHDISMQAGASGSGWGGGDYSAYAFADPIISFVGPHDGYSLAFSPGIGNGGGAGVPEPATWAMMIAGFGLAGASVRRRRAAVAA